MGRYAKRTSVSPQKSQMAIRAVLMNYGADQFGIIESKERTELMFRISGLMVRLAITVDGKANEQQIRQQWRALLLVIKAKLEAVESGITTFEGEFMPNIVMPDGRVLGDHILPELPALMASRKLPVSLLLESKPARVVG